MLCRIAEMKKEETRSSTIRVMHVINSLGFGGAEQVVANYARHLDRTRFSPSVCALRNGGPLFDQLREEGVPVFLIGKSAGADPRTVWRLARLIVREKIDIIHTHNCSAHGWGALAAVASRRPLLVATEHSIHFPGRGGRLYSLVRRSLRHKFSAVISCSEQVRQSQVGVWRLPLQKHVTIFNGIDIPRFEAPSESASLVKEFGLDDDRPVIGAIGSLTPHKSHVSLIKAVAKLKHNGHDPQLLIIGEGPSREQLLSEISRLGLEEDVVLPGIRKDVPNILGLLDVFVLPSSREGFPITILEAMAAGLPIIVTNVGGTSEAVMDGINGIVVPPGSSNALAQALARVLGNREFADHLGKKARESVIEHFSVRNMVEETEALYLSKMNDLAVSPT